MKEIAWKYDDGKKYRWRRRRRRRTTTTQERKKMKGYEWGKAHPNGKGIANLYYSRNFHSIKIKLYINSYLKRGIISFSYYLTTRWTNTTTTSYKRRPFPQNTIRKPISRTVRNFEIMNTIIHTMTILSLVNYLSNDSP